MATVDPIRAALETAARRYAKRGDREGPDPRLLDLLAAAAHAAIPGNPELEEARRELAQARAQITALTAERDQIANDRHAIRQDLDGARAERDTARTSAGDMAQRVGELEAALAAANTATAATAAHVCHYPLDEDDVPDLCDCGQVHPRLRLAYDTAHSGPDIQHGVAVAGTLRNQRGAS